MSRKKVTIQVKKVLNDESVLNGEFVPKERIIVSQSAKDAMKRKPYGMAQAASGTGGTSGTSGFIICKCYSRTEVMQ